MKNFLNFRLPCNQKQPTTALRFLFIMLFAALAGTTPLSGQEGSNLKCQEDIPTFTGIPEQTLCEKYPNFNCEIQIGTGTPFPKSSLLGSSLSGNVCITGNFEVDEPFAFRNALVKINQGVTITISSTINNNGASNWLGIDNSKLFACNGLWKGITLGLLSTIATSNNSEIEDAERAIYASGFSSPFIQQTTFNRNRVGIELNTPSPSVLLPGPIMWTFSGNMFTCNAPLNGTSNEITQVGVKLKDSDLFAFYGNNNNTFKGIMNGIVAEGDASTVYANNYNFFDIQNVGIDFKGRRLEVIHSTFDAVLGQGIYFHESSQLVLTNNEFFVRVATIPIPYVSMVLVWAPKPDNDIRISQNYFYTEGRLPFSAKGIYLISTDISLFNAHIFDNTFDLYNATNPGSETYAIHIVGEMASDSDIDIEINHLNINPYYINDNFGIYVQYGSKHNIHVIHNYLKGDGKIIAFVGSPNGHGNTISDNTIYAAQGFNVGVFLKDFPNTTICSNTNNGASNIAYLFNGNNLGTIFSGNHTYGSWQNTLWISGGINPMISPQVQTGNEWGPAIMINGGNSYFVRPFLENENADPDVVAMSKFIVHTPQSVWNGNQYTYFSAFHPATDEIMPDFNDEFFDEEQGTPIVNCVTQLQSPDEVDVQIATGVFATIIQNVGSVFEAKRFLYKKLMDNPSYQSVHVAFQSFLTTEQNTSIGKFYQLEKAINDAHLLSSSDKSTLSSLKIQQDAIIQLMGQQGTSQSQQILNISALKALDNTAYTLLTLHETNQASLINNAVSIWQSINPQNTFDQYRKDVLGIYLTAQTQQGGRLTASQVDDLQGIGKLCSEDGGSAVYLAQGFLTDCDRAEIMDEIEQCIEIPEAMPRDGEIEGHRILIREDAEVQVSPNPARDWLNVISVRRMLGKADIYSLTGQHLFTKDIAFGENLVHFDLNSGVYLLKVKYENGDISIRKIVIHK